MPGVDVILAALVFLLNGLLYVSFFSRLPDLIATLGLTKSQLGLAMSGMTIGTVLCLSVVSFLAERISAHLRAVLTLCGMVLTLVFTTMSTFTGLFVLMIGLGLCRNLLELTQNQLARQAETRGKRPVMALCHGFWSLGSLAATYLTSLFLKYKITVATHLLVVGMPLLILLVPLLLLNKDDAHTQDKPQNVDSTKPGKGFGLSRPDRPAIILFLTGLGFASCENMLYAWGLFFLDEQTDLHRSKAVLIYSCFTLGMVLVRLTGDRLRAHISSARLFRLMAMAAFAGLSLLLALAFLTKGHSNIDQLLMGLAFMAVGAGVGLNGPLIAKASLDHGGARSFATVSAMFLSVSMVLPPLFGFMAQTGGTWLCFVFILPLLALAYVTKL